MSDFDSATCYKIDGYDKYETVVECVEVWLECEAAGIFGSWHAYQAARRTNGWWSRCRQLGSVTVDAYRIAERVVIDLDNMTDRMMSAFEEAFAHPNIRHYDDIDRLRDHNAYVRCKHAIWAALVDYERSLPVTRLERTQSRTFTADEIVAMLKVEHPEWFQEVANG